MLSTRTLYAATAVVALAFGGVAQAATPSVSGRVQDASGRPLAHVYVHQEGGITSTFTDDQGNFRLERDPKANNRLVLSETGFQPVEVETNQLSRVVTMQPSQVVTAPTIAPAQSSTEPSVLGSSFALRYDIRNEAIGFSGNSVNGTVNNELGLTYRNRFDAWYLTLDAFRNRAAVAMPDLTPNGGTTFMPETLEGDLSLGYVWGLGGLELELPYLAGLYRDVSAGTNGVTYTNTPLDWNETRQAVGIGAKLGWRFAPRWSLGADLAYYPAVTTFDTLQHSPYQLSGLQGGKAGVGISYTLVPGINLGVGFQKQSFGATNFAEDSNVTMLTISSNPSEVTP